MEIAEYTKDELIYFCEKLQKKVKKYEKRLSDLVSAYKELIEEKKILEDSLKAVSQEKKKEEDGSKTFLQKSKEFITKSKQADTTYLTPDIEDVDAAGNIETKFELLTKAFQSLTEKKSKMEVSFQADKKTLMVEHNKTVTQLEEEVSKLTIQVEKLKNNLGREQNDRADDEQLHSSMLTELQNVLATERLMKDELKTQLSQLEKEKGGKVNKDFEVEHLTDGEMEPSKDPTIVNKQGVEEMNKVKEDLVEEQRKTSEAELLFHLRQSQDEDRIFELEQKISEFSVTIGDYEKQRFDDQMIIKKLKHKLENAGQESIPSVVNKISPTIESKGIRSSASSDDYFKFLEADKMAISAKDCSAHEMCNCKQEHRKLKLELENYKSKYMKQQNKDTNSQNSQVIDEYRTQISALKQEKKLVIRNYEEKERNLLEQVGKEKASMQETTRIEIENLRKAHIKQFSNLQLELQKQRNRSMNVISEKDFEIEKLQKAMYDQAGTYTGAVLPVKQIDMISDDLEEFIISPAKKEDGSLFHFIEQNNIDRDMSQLRDQVIDLQETSREAEQREARVLQQMQILKDEIRKLERSRSRESANLEYLKNICLQYMMTSSVSVKKQMSISLSSILQFSPSETKTKTRELAAEDLDLIKEVEKRHSAGWFYK